MYCNGSIFNETDFIMTWILSFRINLESYLFTFTWFISFTWSYNLISHYFLGYINGTRVLMGSYEQFLKTTCFTNMSFLGAIEDGNPDVLQPEVSRYQYFYFYI